MRVGAGQSGGHGGRGSWGSRAARQPLHASHSLVSRRCAQQRPPVGRAGTPALRKLACVVASATAGHATRSPRQELKLSRLSVESFTRDADR